MKLCVAFFSLCLWAGLCPLRMSREAISAKPVPGVPAGLLPVDAGTVPLDDRQRRFLAGFPGRAEVFANGNQTWVVRTVTQPTRKLHPAGDCLRALGYGTAPGPLFQEPNGVCWGTWTATRDGQRFGVRERVVDSRGQSWTDVSAWFWHAVLGRTDGPWWAVTVIERRGK